MEYHFFLFIAFHFTNVDHGFNGGVTSHRQGWCTLCLCCHFAPSCITLAGWEQTLECGETNAGWTWLPGKPWPTMMSHVYNWLRWCFYCSQFRFRNLLRLFTWTSFRKVQKHIPMPVATGAVQMSIQPHVQIPASLGHANIAIAIACSWNMKT